MVVVRSGAAAQRALPADCQRRELVEVVESSSCGANCQGIRSSFTLRSGSVSGGGGGRVGRGGGAGTFREHANPINYCAMDSYGELAWCAMYL